MNTGEHQKGFKCITPENWRSKDEVAQYFIQDPNIWIALYLSPKLAPQVPKDISAMFEVARGSMVYGWYFYPLLTLGMEQCYRITEAAVRFRCQQLGEPLVSVSAKGRERQKSFHELCQTLVQFGVIPESDVEFWEAARKLRNWASHPQDQPINMPGQSAGVLQRTADKINELFTPAAS
ncbi:MAG: hypothetical protein ACO1PN_03390 [Betaproteobacteria bacterium]